MRIVVVVNEGEIQCRHCSQYALVVDDGQRELNSLCSKSSVKMKRDRWVSIVVRKLNAGFLVLDIKDGQKSSKTYHKVVNLSLVDKASKRKPRGISRAYLSV